VLDASAALSLVLGETGGADVRDRLDDTIGAGDQVLAPGLFWLETVNVLALRHRWSPDAIVEAVYELEQVGVTTADVGRPGTLAVIDAVGRLGLTAYDAVHLVLAESSDARLLTADAALAAAAGDRAILVGSDGVGVAEHRPTYRAEPSWASWKGAGRYLAELRRAV
jgi:predicted nucleic acid-binding protein